MSDALEELVRQIESQNGIHDKDRLAKIVAASFQLTKDRSVFYCADFAIRFNSSANRTFSNTVLSLSKLQKYDDRPFIVCHVTPTTNYCLLANTTLLKRISHSSLGLSEHNIIGSFNGSDIVREFEGISNTPENFDRLYAIHGEIGFEGNLARLVEATNNISPSGTKYQINPLVASVIREAPRRAMGFIESDDYLTLKNELDTQVERFTTEILLAALIENINVRGRVIEYLIAGENERLRQELLLALNAGNGTIPQFKTDNTLGDYQRTFDWISLFKDG